LCAGDFSRLARKKCGREFFLPQRLRFLFARALADQRHAGTRTAEHVSTAKPEQLMGRKLLFICGILSSLVYVAANVVGALRWKGYDVLSQTISELSALGAPSRSAWVPLGIAYGVLLIAFGAGIDVYACERRGLRIVGTLLIAIGAFGLFWPPMHLRGSTATLTDTSHIVWASITSVLILVTIGFGARAFGTRFRIYSVATLVALVVFGGLSFAYAPRLAANQPTPWLGLIERLNLGAYLLWVAVLASRLLCTR
jgi:hypothetical protein